MDEDKQLVKWLEICQNLDPTLDERKRALRRIFNYILSSPDLCRSSHQDYLQALGRTLSWVNKNIDKFTSRRGSTESSLMKWVNSYLRWRIKDLYKSDSKFKSLESSLDESVYSESNQTTSGEKVNTLDEFRQLDLLEQQIELLQKAKIARIGEQVEDYLRQDPSGFLRNCHPRNYPNCNCQELAQRISIKIVVGDPKDLPDTIRSIAKNCNMSEQTLYTHWREKCEPRLRVIALRFDRNLKKAIENIDAQNSLKNCCFQNRTSCNCLELVQRLVLADPIGEIQSIAKTFQVNQSDVWKHWENHCLPLLRKYRSQFRP